jgi:hypothetical protein
LGSRQYFFLISWLAISVIETLADIGIHFHVRSTLSKMVTSYIGHLNNLQLNGKNSFLESFSVGEKNLLLAFELLCLRQARTVPRQGYIVAINMPVTKTIKATTNRINRNLERIELDTAFPRVESTLNYLLNRFAVYLLLLNSFVSKIFRVGDVTAWSGLAIRIRLYNKFELATVRMSK